MEREDIDEVLDLLLPHLRLADADEIPFIERVLVQGILVTSCSVFTLVKSF